MDLLNKLHLQYNLSRIEMVSNDFIGFSIDWRGIVGFSFSVLLAILILLVLFSIGRGVFRLLRIQFENFFSNLLFSIAIGYVFFSFSIALYGTFFRLQKEHLIGVFFALVLVSLITSKKILFVGFSNLQRTLLIKLKSKYFVLVSSFVLVAILRLIPPEIGVDAILYHLTFPKVFLNEGTLMISPSGSFFIITIPLSGQMLYIIPELFGLQKTSQILHFLFYLLTLIALYRFAEKLRKGAGILAGLLFVTNGTVIRHASTANVDFMALFLWILILDITFFSKAKLIKNTIIVGLITGGMIATKLQAFAFVPLIFLFHFLKNGKKIHALLFVSLMFIIGSVWFLRSYILTGNPIYPQFTEEYDVSVPHFANLFRLDVVLSRITGFAVNSFPILLGSVFVTFFIRRGRSEFIHSRLFIFVVLLFLNYFFLTDIYFLDRNQLYFIVTLILLISPALLSALRHTFINIFFTTAILILSLYYIVSSLIFLPYGIGWANKEAYLSTVLSRDNSSYYDFENLFEIHINIGDVVAVDGVNGLYYFPFKFVFVDDIFKGDVVSLNDIKQKGYNKLLIKKYDIEAFCDKYKIICDQEYYTLLAYHPESGQYLYQLR